MGEVISPFVPMALDIITENEKAVQHCRYTLLFQGYSIIVTWDRVLIRYEGDLKVLTENNSIIEEPFFNLFDKIKNIGSFGNVLNCLCVTHIINHFDTVPTDINKDFIGDYLNKINIEKIITNPTDVSIILEKNTEGKQITLQFGPYVGIIDLQKRNIFPQNPDIEQHLNIVGEMAEIKILEMLKSISFAKYKELLKMTFEYQESLWKQ
jgi:hypothetical protein